jgi:hypothetical protein
MVYIADTACLYRIFLHSRGPNHGEPWPVTPELYKQLLPPAGAHMCVQGCTGCVCTAAVLHSWQRKLLYPAVVTSCMDCSHRPFCPVQLLHSCYTPMLLLLQALSWCLLSPSLLP